MRLKVVHIPDPNGDWADRIVEIWQEDDAPVPDKERTWEAFKRITGQYDGEPLAVCDRGDWIAYLHYGGWVRIISYEGGAVGVVVEDIDT